jgi:hypothetical protein
MATLNVISSTSSRHWSLLGHQMLAPSSSHAVVIQCRPEILPEREAAEPAGFLG